MRGVLLCAAVCALIATPAVTTAQEFNRAIIDSFDAPTDEQPFGVEWVDDLGVMYLVGEFSSLVYSITPEGDATLLFDIVDAMGFNPGAWAGNAICYVPGSGGRDGSIFIGDYGGPSAPPYHDMVYEFAMDGTPLNSWNVETQCGSGGISGLAFDGTNFWLNCGYFIMKCDTDFELLDLFANPSTQFTLQGGIDYDPVLDVLYIIQYDPCEIYVVDPSDYSTVGSSSVWVNDTCGISVGRMTRDRGRSLWVTSRATDRIYEIEDLYLRHSGRERIVDDDQGPLPVGAGAAETGGA